MIQDNSEEHEGSEETRRDEIGEGNNGEEVNEHEQLVYGTDGGYECKTPKDDNGETHAHRDEQRELEDGECGICECEGLELGEDKVHEPREHKYEPTPVPANQTTPDATSDEPRQFDWANNIDTSIGPVPRVSDFRPTTPSQPVCTPPKPTVTPSNGDAAPTVRTPTTRVPTGPHTHTPSIVHGPHDLSALRSGTSNPWSNLSRRGSHIHPPRDLSVLWSGIPNPWSSLRHRNQRSHPRHQHRTHSRPDPIQYTHLLPPRPERLQPLRNPSVYPEPLPFSPNQVFERITHPFGIGPAKPVIRVPVSTAMDTPAHHAPLAECTVVKSVPPLPQTHQTAAVQCECGRLIPGSEARELPIVPLHRALTTFMSHVLSHPLFFPAHFFSRLRFL
jgi:hypothetical protein